MGESVGFLAVDDIIRHGRDGGSMLGGRDETLERAETHGARMVERCTAKSTASRECQRSADLRIRSRVERWWVLKLC
ncbi:hypothetical protein BGE01nite_47410 [Brevifollis gellanilyticus]|uniref:Uncharacterized protein n=1 Tax=Brevifollis gellanilyticus TaxID=748831 RepID=A0A512MFD3_9BACT|nr:hypothetical protein BGE01nite_47410 [Brevifollis gellanilyticus]